MRVYLHVVCVHVPAQGYVVYITFNVNGPDGKLLGDSRPAP